MCQLRTCLNDSFAEAEQAGVWIICPPQPCQMLISWSQKNCKLSLISGTVCSSGIWAALSSEDIPNLAEQVRRLRICDRQEGRPIIASIPVVKFLATLIACCTSGRTRNQPLTWQTTSVASTTTTTCPTRNTSARCLHRDRLSNS